MFQAALAAACHNPVLKLAANRLNEHGKPHKLVIIAIARRLVTIADAIIKTGIPQRIQPGEQTQLLDGHLALNGQRRRNYTTSADAAGGVRLTVGLDRVEVLHVRRPHKIYVPVKERAGWAGTRKPVVQSSPISDK